MSHAADLPEWLRPGDMLVCLGAGSISAWANALPARVEAGNDHRQKVEA